MSKQKKMYIGNKEVSFDTNEVTGELVILGEESFYKISNVDERYFVF